MAIAPTSLEIKKTESSRKIGTFRQNAQQFRQKPRLKRENQGLQGKIPNSDSSLFKLSDVGRNDYSFD